MLPSPIASRYDYDTLLLPRCERAGVYAPRSRFSLRDAAAAPCAHTRDADGYALFTIAS